MAPERRRVTHNLVALSSAAVLAVYGAGYARTRQAAERLAEAADRPRAIVPAPAVAGPTITPAAEPSPISTTPAVVEPPRPSPAMTKARAASTRPVKPMEPAQTPVVESPAAAATPVETPISAPPAPEPPATLAPTPTPTPAPQSLYKDGTYYGWGTSRHGDIQASVVIEDGRIVSAAITQCLTRYSCSWIAHLPPQVVSRQSPEVDYVSGATQSTNAFYYAILEALTKAK